MGGGQINGVGLDCRTQSSPTPLIRLSATQAVGGHQARDQGRSTGDQGVVHMPFIGELSRTHPFAAIATCWSYAVT